MATLGATVVPSSMQRVILFVQVVGYSFLLSLAIGLWPQNAFAQLSCSSTQITPTGIVSYGPSITADGTRIAFTSDGNLTGQNPDANQETFVFNTTSSTFTQITNTTSGSSFGRISGDGNSIAFINESNPNLFLFNATNNTTTQITNIVPELSGVVGLFTLSADGSRIAFNSNADLTGENPSGVTEIYLFDRTTNTITQITHTNAGALWTPWISADGTRITFHTFVDPTGENPDQNSEIFLFDIGTNTLTQITHTSGPGVVNQRPTANANGTLIAFDSTADLTGGNPDGSEEIFLFNTITNTFQQITSNMGAVTEFAAINANGTRIVFAATGLSLFDLTTQSFTQLTDLQTGEFAAVDADGNRIVVNLGNRISLIECVPTEKLTSLSPASLWIGLKNSDDQGTQFDLRAEVYINDGVHDTLVAAGQTLCITNVTRNPNQAKNVTVPFDSISDGAFELGDTLSLKILTRIGTNPNGTKCSGPGGSHNNAVGLRLYYDAVSRPSQFEAELTPEPLKKFYLHSNTNSIDFFDATPPTATAAKFKDSAAVNFAGGNLWQTIGTWSMTLP